VKRFLLVTILTLASLLTSAIEPGRTATLTVSTMADVVDETDGATSLREAIAGAQAQDTIAFDASLSGATLMLRLGQLTITKALTIMGLGADVLTIDGNGASRVLAIENGANVTISGVTIRGGTTLRNGGGILNNDSTLTLNNCTISGNTGAVGGGIFNIRGELTLNSSTVSGNRGRGGGGIFNLDGTVSLTNSTLSGNVGILSGGGIGNNSGQVRITHSTISNNTVEIANGGGIVNDNGTVQLEQSIVAGNTAFDAVSADCSSFNSALESLGGNLVSVGTGCPTGGSGDQTIDPAGVFMMVLGPLQDNGGSTATHALPSGSPAIDAASTCPPPTADQRGITRPQGVRCDIGAFEAQRPDNQRPIANAGPDQTVNVGTQVVLDGSGSHDPDGDTLSFQWRFSSSPPGSMATLSNATTPNPSFIADLMGTYVVELQVRDDQDVSEPATVSITAMQIPTPRRPIANAGLDQTVAVGTQVVLDGSGSHDPDGDTLSFQWRFSSSPPGSGATLSNATTPNPSFIADLMGTYVVELQVRDDQDISEPTTVRITADPLPPPTNQRPIANAGPDRTVVVGEQVVLDGSGSHDLDGNNLSYEWRFSSSPPGSGATLSNPTVVNPSFEVRFAGLYVLELTVHDGQEESDLDTVRIRSEEEEISSE
jgi:hypothetical protein